MKKIFLFVISIVFMNGCMEKDSNIDNLEVFYLPEGTTTDIPIECNHLYPSMFEFDLLQKTFVKQSILKKFKDRLLNLTISEDKPDMDIRIRIMINYANKKVDTLCLGEYFGTYLNGKRMIDDQELLRMVKNEIYRRLVNQLFEE